MQGIGQKTSQPRNENKLAVEIEGAVFLRKQAYLVTGLIGTPLPEGQGPWLEALLGFPQVDEAGKADALPEGAGSAEMPGSDSWRRLAERMHQLLHLRRSN